MKGALRVILRITCSLRWPCGAIPHKMADVAIYHFSAKTVSRADGRSSVAAASYRSGERIVDERTGEIHDYTRKGGVVDGGVVLPDGGTMTRAQLWNGVEAKHKRGDAIVAREFELALPHELTDAQRRVLVDTYSAELADQYGVAVDWNIHAAHGDELNHHAHVLLSACHVSADGTMGKKAVELDPIHCKRAGILNPMETQRARWERLANDMLQRVGHDVRIDHRTLEAQGITDRLPGVHMGPTATGMAARGEVSNIEARAKRKADEFIAKVQADAAIKAAAERDVRELERELEEAKKEAARPRTRKELEAELVPMLAHLKTAQMVIEEGDRRRPNAKPLATIAEAKKALPVVKQRAEQAKATFVQVRDELAGLGWWRPFRKMALSKELPLARQAAVQAEQRLEACTTMTKATPLETLEEVVAKHKQIQIELAPQCLPLESALKAMDAQEAIKQAAIQAKEAALQAAREAEAAKERGMQLAAEKAAQKAEYGRLVAETRAYRAANLNWRREQGVQQEQDRSNDYDSPGLG